MRTSVNHFRDHSTTFNEYIILEILDPFPGTHKIFTMNIKLPLMTLFVKHLALFNRHSGIPTYMLVREHYYTRCFTL